MARFNAQELRNKVYAHFVTQYRSAHMYLGYEKQGKFWPVYRLTYTGNMKQWEFAIYKYSSERYDSEEWLFNGSGEINGSIESALRAGLQAYPP